MVWDANCHAVFPIQTRKSMMLACMNITQPGCHFNNHNHNLCFIILWFPLLKSTYHQQLQDTQGICIASEGRHMLAWLRPNPAPGFGSLWLRTRLDISLAQTECTQKETLSLALMVAGNMRRRSGFPSD